MLYDYRKRFPRAGALWLVQRENGGGVYGFTFCKETTTFLISVLRKTAFVTFTATLYQVILSNINMQTHNKYNGFTSCLSMPGYHFFSMIVAQENILQTSVMTVLHNFA